MAYVDVSTPGGGTGADWSPNITTAFSSANPGDIVRIPTPTGGAWTTIRMDSTITMTGRVGLIYDGDYFSLQSNHSGPAFLLNACKDLPMLHVNGLWLNTSNSQGFLLGNTSSSCSGIEFDRCRVEIDNSVTGCTCYQIGSVNSNDVSDVTLHKCISYTNILTVAGAHTNRNKGLQFLGSNTLHCAAAHCTFVGMDVCIAQQNASQVNQGGAGSTFYDCGGSYNNLAFWLNGGMDARITGGRWELGAAFALLGNEQTSGRGQARVSMHDVRVDAYDASNNGSLGYIDKNSLIGIFSNAEVVIDGVGGILNTFDPHYWLAVRSNLLPGPTVVSARSFGGTCKPLEGAVTYLSQNSFAYLNPYS